MFHLLCRYFLIGLLFEFGARSHERSANDTTAWLECTRPWDQGSHDCAVLRGKNSKLLGPTSNLPWKTIVLLRTNELGQTRFANIVYVEFYFLPPPKVIPLDIGKNSQLHEYSTKYLMLQPTLCCDIFAGHLGLHFFISFSVSKGLTRFMTRQSSRREKHETPLVC
jgi:hypothetical protein